LDRDTTDRAWFTTLVGNPELRVGGAKFTAGSAATGMYRGLKLWEAAVKEAGTLDQAAVIRALDHAKIAQGPGGPAEMVPGHASPEEHARNPLHFRLTQEKKPDFSAYYEDQGIHGFHSHLHDEEELKKNIAIYYGMISLMDSQIGRILEALDRLGVAGETLVVFTTDHGHFLGQHGLIAKGAFHYEDMIRVPFIVRWPGKAPAGEVSQALQSLVDLAPTFLAAAGREIPGVMTGVNQLPAWCEGRPVRDHAIVENRHTFKNVHHRTYVEDRYKITVYRQGEDGELFDLVEDPSEINNLWHDPQAAELKCRLLQRFLQATLAAEPTRMPRIAGA